MSGNRNCDNFHSLVSEVSFRAWLSLQLLEGSQYSVRVFVCACCVFCSCFCSASCAIEYNSRLEVRSRIGFDRATLTRDALPSQQYFVVQTLPSWVLLKSSQFRSIRVTDSRIVPSFLEFPLQADLPFQYFRFCNLLRGYWHGRVFIQHSGERSTASEQIRHARAWRPDCGAPCFDQPNVF